jgi:hypothetical protein
MHACMNSKYVRSQARTYRWVGPSVVQLPPVQEPLARLPRQPAALLLLLPGELPPEASQVAAVLVQELALQEAGDVAGLLLIFGRTPALVVVVASCLIKTQRSSK